MATLPMLVANSPTMVGPTPKGSRPPQIDTAPQPSSTSSDGQVEQHPASVAEEGLPNTPSSEASTLEATKPGPTPAGFVGQGFTDG